MTIVFVNSHVVYVFLFVCLFSYLFLFILRLCSQQVAAARTKDSKSLDCWEAALWCLLWSAAHQERHALRSVHGKYCLSRDDGYRFCSKRIPVGGKTSETSFTAV